MNKNDEYTNDDFLSDFQINEYPDYYLNNMMGKLIFLCKNCGIRTENPEVIETRECNFCEIFGFEKIKTTIQ